jgi:hypothetical protein
VYVSDLHVHEVDMNNLVRVLGWLERAAVWSLLGLGDIAGIALDAVGQELVFE